MGRLVRTGLGSSSLVAHVLQYPPPPRKQLCTRSCSNKHTRTSLRPGYVPRRAVPCVYYCSTYYKAVREGGGGENGGHVLRETTSRGLCELVCPSRTNERGGEGYLCERRRGRRRYAFAATRPTGVSFDRCVPYNNNNLEPYKNRCPSHLGMKKARTKKIY